MHEYLFSNRKTCFVCFIVYCYFYFAGLPRSGKNIWKMKFFPGQGKVWEFCKWQGKYRKDLESQGKVREFEKKWLWQAFSENLLILLKRGKDVL